jgi:hypothetical protein
MKLKIWIFLVILFAIPGCEEKNDFRDPYTGHFYFTVECFEWHTGVPVNIVNRPTVNYNGTINLYEKGDYSKDLNRLNSVEYKDADQRLTICFSSDCIITPAISENGTLVSEGGPHYDFDGQFNNNHEVEFTVKDLGSVGLTLNYHVLGARE